MCYHCVVLSIFRPFLKNSKGKLALELAGLPSFWSRDNNADSIFNASLNQLKQIIFEYYFFYPPESHSIVFNVALLQVATASLAKPSTSDSCRDFLFCVRCWQGLYICYPVFADILQAYLSIALRNGVLTTKEVEKLSMELRAKGGHHDKSMTATTSILVDFDLALTEPKEAQTHTLAERFTELSLFADLTEGD